MTGRGFLDLLTSDRGGIIDPSRDHVLMGRERHDVGREDDLGYPVRCYRDHQWLYIWNCAPDRWPSGNPETGYTELDGSPTKNEVLLQKELGNDLYWQLAMGKRPGEELYAIQSDPHCMENLAGRPEYAGTLAGLRRKLMAELREQGDPRLDAPDYFEGRRYTGVQTHGWQAYRDGTWQPQGY
jgi:hypothetical protein